MTTNKVLAKHLLPSFLTGGIVITSIFTTLIVTGVQEMKDKKEVRLQDIFMSVIILGAISFLFCPLIDSYKGSNMFTSNTARKYLKRCIKEHPELKDFESVFKNPQALKSVATMISNSLRPEEQKRILGAIAKIQQYTYRSNEEKVVAMLAAQRQIIQILQEHAATDPQFINEIYAQMAYADTTYVMPAQQNVR